MRLKAILLLRCPLCCRGAVFARPFGMNEDCPVCGTHFEREQGYFMMAAFVGYVMGFFVVAPAILLTYFWLNPDWMGYVVVAGLVLIVAIPFLFHYARVIWMHIDQLVDPRPEPGAES